MGAARCICSIVFVFIYLACHWELEYWPLGLIPPQAHDRKVDSLQSILSPGIASSLHLKSHPLRLTMIATMTASAIPLGGSVPALTAHAISVSLPTWEDNIGYEEGDKRVVDKMETGYPRFFIHRSIKKVS